MTKTETLGNGATYTVWRKVNVQRIIRTVALCVIAASSVVVAVAAVIIASPA